MKRTEASVLVVLSSLAALTRARKLQFDDVPVECATICGPIVELSFKCDVDDSFDELRRLKRRKVEAVEHRIPHPKAGGGGGVVRARHHHRRPNENQDQADAEATPTLPLDAVATDGTAQQQQPAQDAQQPPPDASPVFIATLPSAASGEDLQLSATPSAQVTPSEAAQTTTTPSPDAQPSSSSSSSSSSAPPPPPPSPPPPPPSPSPQAPTSVLVVPVFAQPTWTVFVTVPAQPLPPMPQVTVPAPLLSLLPPIQLPTSPAVMPPPPPPPPQQAPPRPPQSQQPGPAPSSQRSTTSSSPPPPQASMSTPTAVPATGEGPGKKGPDQKPPADAKDTAEKNCICGNKSFDVNLLAGMCQSCIRKSGNRASDMYFIMGQCNLTEATYTPDQDKLVYNIRVVAQRPLLSHSANAMGDAGRIGVGCALAATAVGLVAGLVLLL